MIIDQLFTRPVFEEAPMASPEQLAYNRLRAQYDSYQTMTGGGGNTAVSRDPAHAAKLAKVPAEIARMAAALKAKGIDAEAQYDALSGPAAAPVDANQAYGGVSEVAPPGAKAERMVRHIKAGYARDGKLTPKEKGIAFATAWKAHNAGRVEETTGDERFDSMMGQIQREPRIPDSQMPPTDVKDLYHWAVKHHKPYHKIFAKWANREGFKSVAPALQKAGNLDSDALDYWTPDVWKLWYGPDSEMPRHWSKERVPEELRDYLETVFDAYDRIVFDWPTEYRQISEQGEVNTSRRGFLKKAAGAAAAGAAMSAAGPEIVTLVKGFAEQAGGMNGIQALKAMLKIATPEELYNMYEYYADSGILEDAITDSDMIRLDRAGYDSWSEFEEHCDENGVDPDDEFQRLTGRPLKVKLVDDIVGKVDDTWSLEEFFDEYPDALKIINPFENGSISMPTMQQLAKIDTAAKGASLPTPIVAMANAVAGLVRQIFKANGQPLAGSQQVSQTSRAAPALPAPARPEFDMTPDLKQKEKVPVPRQGDDDNEEPEDPEEMIQRFINAGLNRKYGPQKPGSSQIGNQDMAEAAQGHTIEAHGVRGMDRRTWHKTFRNTDQMIAWAEKHDAEIIGTRDLEQARHHNLSPARQDMAEGRRTGEYSRVLRALGLYYPDKFSMEELNTPDWHRVIAYKADVPVEYAGKVINDFTRPYDYNDEWPEDDEQDVTEGSDQQLSVRQLATISDEALDKAYGYGRSSPGNTFGWQANLKSAAYAKHMIDKGVTDIDEIADAIHKGWNVTAKAFVKNPDRFDDTEKLKAAGKLEAKLQQRAKLMNIDYSQLPDDEQEKDRVVARALLQAITGGGEQGVTEGHKESYVIVRTDREGKKDVFAGNFDTYERAQKELDDCLAHPLHTKYKQKFEIKRKGHKDITEMDKSQPSAGRDTGPREGPEGIGKPITKEKMVKRALDALAKSMAKKDDKKKDVKDVKEGNDVYRTPPNFLGDIVPTRGPSGQGRINVGDYARYLGQKVEVIDVSPDGKNARIDIPRGVGGIIQNVLTSDLVQIQQPGRGSTGNPASQRPVTNATPKAMSVPPTFQPNTNARGGGGMGMNPDPLAQLMRESGIGSEPLMNKLQEAMVQDPAQKAAQKAQEMLTVKSDLESLNDADFMKKYGMSKSTTRNLLANSLRRPTSPGAALISKISPGYKMAKMAAGAAVGAVQNKLTSLRNTNPEQWDQAMKDAKSGIIDLKKPFPTNPAPPRRGDALPSDLGTVTFKKSSKYPASPSEWDDTTGSTGMDPLMKKLQAAMVKEGRVKELADDLKTMNDADFMKKYGKAKAAIRADMKRVDEATPAMPAAPAAPVAPTQPAVPAKAAATTPVAAKPAGQQPFKPTQVMDPQQAAAANKAAQEFMQGLMAQLQQIKPVAESRKLNENWFTDKVAAAANWVQQKLKENPLIEIGLRFLPVTSTVLAITDVIGAIKGGNLADATRMIANLIPGGQQLAQAVGAGQAVASGDIAGAAQKAAGAAGLSDLSAGIQAGQVAQAVSETAPVNELSTNKLAQYKTAAAKDAKAADQAGDFKRGDKRLSGIVKATKKQFDNDAKKVDESRAARRALMARIVNSR